MHIYAPQGKKCGGICEHFAIFFSAIALTALNVTNDVLSNMDFWIKTWELSPYSQYIDPERMLYVYFLTLGSQYDAPAKAPQSIERTLKQ
jgi:hypothetical protein